MGRTPLFTLRVDPGWLYVIAGSAMCAAIILVPAQNDLEELRTQRDELREQDDVLAGRLEAHAELLDEIDNADPMLVKRLAASQLNRVADGAEPRVLTGRSPEARGDWIEAVTRRLPVTRRAPLAAAAPPREMSLLARLADGPHRLWILGASVMCIFVGLLMTPAPREDRAAGALAVSDPDHDRADDPPDASGASLYIEDEIEDDDTLPPGTEPVYARVPKTDTSSPLDAMPAADPAGMLGAHTADDEADIIDEDEVDDGEAPEPLEMTAAHSGVVESAVDAPEQDVATEMPPVETEEMPVEEHAEEDVDPDEAPDDDDEYEYEYEYVYEDEDEDEDEDAEPEGAEAVEVGEEDEEYEEDEGDDEDEDEDEEYEDEEEEPEDDAEYDEEDEDEDEDEEEEYEDEDEPGDDDEYEDEDEEDDDDDEVEVEGLADDDEDEDYELADDDGASTDDEDDDEYEYEYVYEDEDDDDDEDDRELVDADADADEERE